MSHVKYAVLMAKKMGRPPIPATQRRSRVVHIRLTAQEKKDLVKKAKAVELPLVAWMRRRLLGDGE